MVSEETQFRLEVALSVLAAVIVMSVSIFLVLTFGKTVDVPHSGLFGARATVVRSAVIIFTSAAVLNLIFCLFAGIGYARIRRGTDLSSLYWPLAVFSGLLTFVVNISAINSLDRLIHDLMLKWNFAGEPEIQFISNTCLFLSILCLAWLGATLLRAQGSPRRTISILWLILGVVAVVAAVASFYVSNDIRIAASFD